MVVQTRNTRYLMVDIGDGGILISGDPNRCPRPTLARLLSPIAVGRPMNYRPVQGQWADSHPSPTAFVMTSTVMSIEP